MNASTSRRGTYLAAFLLGALLALIAAMPARAGEAFRLDRVAIVRFSDLGDGKLLRQSGVLHLDGRTEWRGSSQLSRPANTPDWALDRFLVSVHAWLGYYGLGPESLANFELAEGSVRFAIGSESFHFVAPNPLAFVASGRLINISTLARIAAGGDEIVAGFVIEDRPRVVLVRAVGPGLERFNIPGTPDPALLVRRDGQTLTFNDNWWTAADANRTRRAAARVGAFPLDDQSRDAARVLRLGPGSYTLHAHTAAPDVPGGKVLLEVYSVPEEPDTADNAP